MGVVQRSWVATGVVVLAAVVCVILTGSQAYAKGIIMGGGLAIIVFNLEARK